jgi:hypothetical protein
MAETQASREEQIRDVLINAVEVQLAALKAGGSFWREWLEQTSAFVKTATATLGAIRNQEKSANQLLLETVDAGRETMRTMTELPRKAATRFIHELDEIEQKHRPAAPRKAAGTRSKTRARRARRGRVKP